MAGLSLIALLDDIAAVLDDVALMTKVAAKKTAGVLGDDLALNAQQVSGVKADRELPVVWAVAKGSFANKLILVPSALALSVFLPVAINILLIVGGLFLCFEGFEKVFHALFPHTDNEQQNKHQRLQANSDDTVDLVAFEKDKIKGAIRTDFILSAEIIVIALGTVNEAALLTQILVVSGIAFSMTIGVYGLVAGIVKLDDAGLYLLEHAKQNNGGQLQQTLGKGLLGFAPILMKFLVVVGTAAMFLVGGGILSHGIPMFADWTHHVQHWAGHLGAMSPIMEVFAPIAYNALLGIVAGGVVMSVITLIKSVSIKAD
ncbi:DUF808 domain-containing protein [Agarivorans sp. 1_MG-2023]|uniref:DUF808 domain-containing protein n=1 Tax=Agarivorans sp. 1_MG-2023 TaxID=3062634 RepID=UPI0026E1D750|nr:DUF808 domain-containing protein [Agarivorans sp. 1_MG-2023]MDO6764047.1 DUF808 domain-containing protein [Agarivorans sp. 1_MG-2023]